MDNSKQIRELGSIVEEAVKNFNEKEKYLIENDCIYGFDNLICLEMKKSKDRRGCNSDENRLKCMTSREYGFNYKLGIMLVVDYKIKEMVIKSKLVDGEEIEL